MTPGAAACHPGGPLLPALYTAPNGLTCVVAIIAANGRGTHVGTTQPVARFTYEDYRTAPADERYELLDGDPVMAPVPNLKHQRVQFRLGRRLGQFIEERHGVAQYWLVDPAEGTVSLHCRRGGALTAALTFGRGETLHSPLLAGLNIDLDDVFS